MNYRREVDGLRAVAVLPVIFYHAGFAGFSGGFVGVDVFFVISGYLITGVLLGELRSGSFSFLGFYERRARRILPALFFVVLVSLPLAWLAMLPPDLKLFSASVTAVPAFASNFFFYRTSGYFDPSADLNPLLHTWSLAVEEQYYLLYPLLLAVVWRLGLRALVVTLAAGLVISLAAAHWTAASHPYFGFYLLPTRGWELLLGAFVALDVFNTSHVAKVPGRVREMLAVLGVLAIFVSVAIFNERTPSPSLYTLIPTVGTALILAMATPPTLTGRFLGHRILVGIGLISYSAYLWHHPLFAFAKHWSLDPPTPVVFALLSAASLALAFFSWKYVETPFRERHRFTRRQIFSVATAVGVALAAVGALGVAANGFETYYYTKRLSEASRGNYRLIQQHTGINLYDHMVDDGRCMFWSRDVDASFVARFEGCAREFGAGVIVLGDSHAMNVYNIVAKAKVSPFIAGLAQGGCRPHRSLPHCQYEPFVGFARDHAKSIGMVIFHQSGAYLVSDPDGTLYYDSRHQGDVDRFGLDAGNVAAVQNYLSRLASVTPTVWLGPFVESGVPFDKLRRFENGFRLDGRDLPLFHRVNAELARSQHTPAHAYGYVPFENVFGIDESFLRVGDCITYFNLDHFSLCGEDLIAPHLAKTFNQLQAAAGVDTGL